MHAIFSVWLEIHSYQYLVRMGKDGLQKTFAVQRIRKPAGRSLKASLTMKINGVSISKMGSPG